MIFQAHFDRSIRAGLAFGWGILFGTAMSSGEVMAQTTGRVSVDSAGVQGNNWSGLTPSFSADGRYVAFFSEATNLVPGDTNGFGDVFVHDRQTATTQRVSISSSGEQGNNSSMDVGLSADGRFVAFASAASNLVTGDTGPMTDIFVHDRQTGYTERVTGQANGASDSPSISANGRYVAFSSEANNLVLNDTNGVADVFVHDSQTGLIQRVSLSSAGVQGNYVSSKPHITDDGRYVAFLSRANNLVSIDGNGLTDAFVRDLQASTTAMVSVASSGAQGYGFADSVSISRDGRYVAFGYSTDDLVSDDTNNASDVFVHDRITGETRRVSVSSSGTQGNAAGVNPALSSFDAHISSNGRYVAFSSYADNLVSGDVNDRVDVFVHDRQSGATELASVSTAGDHGDGSSFAPNVSGDGRYVAFQSYAANLVSDDTNGVPDVLVRDRGAPDGLTNISTRTRVQTGNNVMIGGFWIGGTDPITVLIRARGGSLGGAPFNNPGVLANPTMQLYSGATVIAQSNDWQSTDPLCVSPATECGDAAQIIVTGLDPCQPNPGQSVAPPGCSQESALLVTLPPGGYTAMVSGVGGTVGMGLVEVFKVDTNLSSLINISTRARVETGNNVMIGGFWVSGTEPKTVLIRARGGSLGGVPFNNPGVLANPTMQLFTGSTAIAQNNDWVVFDATCLSPCVDNTPVSDTSVPGLTPCEPNPSQTVPPPGCAQESAILVTLAPGGYTAIVSGVGGTSGMGLVEVFEVGP